MTSQPCLRRVLGSGVDLEKRARARAARLAELHHPRVLAPDRIEVEASGEVVAYLPVVKGRDMAELSRERAPLTAGELVWWGQQVAQGLAALHAHGLIHGDLSPRNIVVGSSEVTLVDTMAAVLDSERGTVGFRAPEVVAGEPCEASDVYALGRLLKWCADDDAGERAAGVITAMTSPTPQHRPLMVNVPSLLSEIAPAHPLSQSAPVDVASALRSGAQEHTVRMARGRAWRARTWALRAGVGVAGLSLIAALWWGATSLFGDDSLLARDTAPVASPSHAVPSTTPLVTAPEPSQPDAVVATAAADLTKARFAALAAANGAALRATVAGDSSFADGVRAQAEDLDSGDLSYEGLQVSEIEARTAHVGSESAQVRVSYVVSEHRVRKRDAVTGEETVTPRAEASEAVMLTLDRSADTDSELTFLWRVVGAVPAPLEETSAPEQGPVAAG